jgi:hypothetical protein
MTITWRDPAGKSCVKSGANITCICKTWESRSKSEAAPKRHPNGLFGLTEISPRQESNLVERHGSEPSQLNQAPARQQLSISV